MEKQSKHLSYIWVEEQGTLACSQLHVSEVGKSKYTCPPSCTSESSALIPSFMFYVELGEEKKFGAHQVGLQHQGHLFTVEFGKC